VIGGQYRLRETPTTSSIQRTEWNIRDSDGTAIFTFAPHLAGGSKRTAGFAEKLRRPWIHIARSSHAYRPAAVRLQEFLEEREGGDPANGRTDGVWRLQGGGLVGMIGR
jgi:hypothetical protein